MTGSQKLARLLHQQRQFAGQLKPLVDRTARPQFNMSDEEFALMDALSRELEAVNAKILALGGTAARSGPTTKQ